MTPDEQDEISIVAARDLDGGQRCSWCGKTRRAKALLPGGDVLCRLCWERRKR